jgi:hypothetical protein
MCFAVVNHLYAIFQCQRLTAGVTGKGGNWRRKPPDAESAVGARIPESAGSARTCPVHAVLGSFEPYEKLAESDSAYLKSKIYAVNYPIG